MDSNAVLAELREWAEAKLAGGTSVLDDPGAAQSMQVLDAWLSKGGFLPEEWQR